MDWGLIMSGALGGGARAAGEMADNTIKRRDLDLAQQRAEQVAIQGEQRRAMLQRENAAYEMDLKLKQQDEQGKRYQAQTDKIGDRAAQIGLERDDRSMTTARDSLPQSGEFAGQDITTAELAALPPAARAAYEKAGLINKVSGSQQLRDEITAAREIGADKPVRDDLRSSYDKQVTAELNQTKEDRSKQELARKEAKDASDREVADRRLEVMMAKIGASGNKAEKSEKVMTFMNGQIRQLNSESEDVAAQLKADLKANEFASPEEKAAIRAEYAPRLNAIAQQRQQLNADFDSLRDRFGLPATTKAATSKPEAGSAKPTMASLPAGAKQIGTSGGKPVYQTPDGKKFVAN